MKQSLLIADGDAELCDICEVFLTEQGYEAETAFDGLDCLRKLRQATPAALVLDLELRWGGGEGILAWLREERLAHEISVILTTAAERPRNFEEFIDPPVVACLRKPFAVTALLESVRSGVTKNGRREPSNRHHFQADSELCMDGTKELSMNEPAAFSDLPLHKHAGQEQRTLRNRALPRTQRLEDICLAERIVHALHATGYGGLRSIKVCVNNRIVHLEGRVSSFHLKQIAQVTVLAIPGTHQIQNDLDVIWPK